MKTLAQLQQWTDGVWQTGQPGLQINDHLQVNQLTHQTQFIEPGWGFVALPGQRHGIEFWQAAAQRGAVCIISDQPIENCHLPVLIVADLPQRVAALADWFYDQPSRKLGVVGVTGTNGKTSTTHYIAQLLVSQGARVGMVGTLGNGEYGHLEDSPNTTPEALTLQRWLAHFVEMGLDWVVMEVSSHGLALGRIKGIQFACVALTQVTRDHLDFHLDVADYQRAKCLLFEDYVTRHRVINADDAVGKKLLGLADVFSYSLHANNSNLKATNLTLSAHGIQLELCYTDQQEQVSLPLMGRFNAENVMCALSCVLALGYAFNAVLPALAELQAVCGRMQPVVNQANQVTAIVDYAHTPDALEQVLLALRAHIPNSQLWVVFGCGGDRDRGKRPLMGAVAERLADKVVLTSDNPRSEDPQHILAEIAAGMQAITHQEISRQVAIEWALSHAQPGDVVLVAGKGHEQYQEINGVKTPFSDQQVIQKWRKT